MKTQMDMDAYERAVYDNDALSLSLARTLQEQDDTAAAVEMTGAQTPPQPPVQASSSNVQRSHEHDEAEDRRVAQVQQDLNATAGLQLTRLTSTCCVDIHGDIAPSNPVKTKEKTV